MIRDDYLLRLLKQLGEFLARIARRREEGRWRDAFDELDRAWSELLDIPRDLAVAVDTATLCGMLTQPERMRGAARLFREEGRVHAAGRDPLSAARSFTRARELFVQARAIEPSEGDDDAILELTRLIAPGEPS